MTINILISPATFQLYSTSYARTYRFLRRLDASDIKITAIINSNKVDQGVFPANVRITELGSRFRIGFFMRSYFQGWKELHERNTDVYHHLNFRYRQMNPAIFASHSQKVPTLLGPVESGHAVPPREQKRIILRQFNNNTSKWTTDIVYQASKPLITEVINPLREFLFAKTVEQADRIVAVHSDAKEAYARYTDFEKIDVIPYGVDMEKFPYAERTDSDEFVVVGNLIERKGHRYLLRAMQRVTDKYPTAHLHIVGSGPLREELEQTAKGLGVEDAVTFHGFVEDDKLLDLLHTARAFVHPSLSEGFSHVRLEAMSAGCPVIGTAVDGAYDLTRDGTDGIIVPTESPCALADAMLRLMADDELVYRMGQNAREKVERDHDYADIGRQYLEIYRELADQ